MLSAGEWVFNQQNMILFVMVDATGAELSGLGGTFTLQISKAGAGFVGSAGVKAEIGSGWYSYLSTSGEADTVGPVGVKVTGVGAQQQNLEYVVAGRNALSVPFQYTATDQVSGDPIEGADVGFYPNNLYITAIWRGFTDAFGVARDLNGNLPLLDLGTYYIRVQKAGYQLATDIEIVNA